MLHWPREEQCRSTPNFRARSIGFSISERLCSSEQRNRFVAEAWHQHCYRSLAAIRISVRLARLAALGSRTVLYRRRYMVHRAPSIARRLAMRSNRGTSRSPRCARLAVIFTHEHVWCTCAQSLSRRFAIRSCRSTSRSPRCARLADSFVQT